MLTILLAFCMVLSTAACGSSSKDSVPVSDAGYAEYAGYQFSGTDPWGGTLSITVRTIVDGKMEWTFTDVFDNHTLYQEQSVGGEGFLNCALLRIVQAIEIEVF